MKTLTNLKSTVSNGKITITADIVEREFKGPVQQTTMLDIPDGNQQWVRHVQLSNKAFFIKRLGNGLALPVEEWIAEVANKVEPKLTYAPLPKKTGLTVEFSSELNPDLQWQAADKANAPEAEWNNIEGATSASLVPDAIPKGKFVRCLAKSSAGATATPPVLIK